MHQMGCVDLQRGKLIVHVRMGAVYRRNAKAVMKSAGIEANRKASMICMIPITMVAWKCDDKGFQIWILLRLCMYIISTTHVRSWICGLHVVSV